MTNNTASYNHSISIDQTKYVEFDIDDHNRLVEEFLKKNDPTYLPPQKNPKTENFRTSLLLPKSIQFLRM